MSDPSVTIPIDLGRVIPLEHYDPIHVPTVRDNESAISAEVFVVCRWPDGREEITVMAAPQVGYGFDVEVRLA